MASLGASLGGVSRAPLGVVLDALALGLARAVRFRALCFALALVLAPHVLTRAFPFVASYIHMYVSRPSVRVRRETWGWSQACLGLAPSRGAMRTGLPLQSGRSEYMW